MDQQPIPTLIPAPAKPNFLVPILILLTFLSASASIFLYYQNQQLKQELTQLKNLPANQITSLPTPPRPIPLSSPNVVDPTANWKTYTSEASGISFRYPANWNISASTPPDTFSVILSDQPILTGPHDGPSGQIEIRPNVCTNTVTNQTYPCDTSITERIQKLKEGYTIDSFVQKSVTVGGKQGMQVAGVFGLGFMEGTYMKEVSVPWNQYLLIFTVYSRDYEQIFDQILSTFQFTN